MYRCTQRRSRNAPAGTTRASCGRTSTAPARAPYGSTTASTATSRDTSSRRSRALVLENWPPTCLGRSSYLLRCAYEHDHFILDLEQRKMEVGRQRTLVQQNTRGSRTSPAPLTPPSKARHIHGMQNESMESPMHEIAWRTVLLACATGPGKKFVKLK